MSASGPRRRRGDFSHGIQIFVAGIGNGTMTLHQVRADQQISSLRRRIQEKARVDDSFHLYYGCKFLEDRKTLSDYYILNMSTLNAKFAFGRRLPGAEEGAHERPQEPERHDLKSAPMSSHFYRIKRQRARVLTMPDTKIIIPLGSSLDRSKRQRCFSRNMRSDTQPCPLVPDLEVFAPAQSARRRKYRDVIANGVEWVPGKKRATESVRRRILLVKRANAFTIQVRS
uniref:Ubiquitin-like domain-containing protein n=1 Tax=Lotharella globosa TaxID=91324 RepID=A0A6U3CMA7_9EUKA|mmetsp:Transcript_22053/g.44252  ORF Transcript_22053/g.44252 Transcript_22053/m.44252 type:complete len:228 (+) Transcript_22053:59-742(+)